MTDARIEHPAVYRVLMSDVLFEELGAGVVDWGEPDAEGFYSPVIRTTAERDTPEECPICHKGVVNDARGGPHPSPGDHDPGEHVLAAYGLD